MAWQNLLATTECRILPWFHSNVLYERGRSWEIRGTLPPEFGWWSFATDGSRKAAWRNGESNRSKDFGYAKGHLTVSGYVAGGRLIPDDAGLALDPTFLAEQTKPLHLVEEGLGRFARAVAVRTPYGLVYMEQGFPLGPEADVEAAYLDRKPNLTGIAGVTPALALAFRWLCYQRDLAEGREAKRIAEAKLAEARKTVGSSVGRRALAAQDFANAARAALAVTGATLLDTRPSTIRGEMVVQYVYKHRRLECVVDGATLQVVDSGVCLTDHAGVKGDTWLSLEALPSVIGEALRLGKLVVYRHVAGDTPYGADANGGDEDEDDDW